MSTPSSSGDNPDVFVKTELTNFIMEHTGVDSLNDIDEIVLNYITGILEFLDLTDAAEDSFDVDAFVEMMSSFIPAFAKINSEQVSQWMFQLAKNLKEHKETNENMGNPTSNPLKADVKENTNLAAKASSENLKVSQCDRSRRRCYTDSRSCSSSFSEDEDKHVTVDESDNGPDVDTLVEMFPGISIIEAKKCLGIADGDCSKAVQIILKKLESGENLDQGMTSNSTENQRVCGSSETILDDKKLREQILNRYAYIDQDEDKKEHKPVVPKVEPKKLIRYRYSKIVSVKGERYSEVDTNKMAAKRKEF